MTIDEKSFHSQLANSLFPNIYTLDGLSLEDNKIEKIRELKEFLSKSSLNQGKDILFWIMLKPLILIVLMLC